MRSHIDHDVIDLLPPELLVQAETLGRRFDVSPGLVAVGGRETLPNEHCAQTPALVGGQDDQKIED